MEASYIASKVMNEIVQLAKQGLINITKNLIQTTTILSCSYICFSIIIIILIYSKIVSYFDNEF